MMNTYVWSAKKNQFLPVSLQDSYVAAGSWPDDTVDISDELAATFMETPPAGKNRGVVDGMPAWVDIPPPTHEQYVAQAENQKTVLLNDTNAYINSKQWPGKAALGRLKDTEKAQYNVWLDYLDALDGVDTSAAPDIDWPKSPTK